MQQQPPSQQYQGQHHQNQKMYPTWNEMYHPNGSAAPTAPPSIQLDLLSTTSNVRMLGKRTWGETTTTTSAQSSVYPFNHVHKKACLPLPPILNNQQQDSSYNPRSIYQMLAVESPLNTTSNNGFSSNNAAEVNEDDAGWIDGLFNILDDTPAPSSSFYYGGGSQQQYQQQQETTATTIVAAPMPPPPAPFAPAASSSSSSYLHQQPVVSQDFIHNVVDDALSEISDSDWNLLLEDPTPSSPTGTTIEFDFGSHVEPNNINNNGNNHMVNSGGGSAACSSLSSSTDASKEVVAVMPVVISDTESSSMKIANNTKRSPPARTSLYSSYLEEMKRNYEKCTQQKLAATRTEVEDVQPRTMTPTSFASATTTSVHAVETQQPRTTAPALTLPLVTPETTRTVRRLPSVAVAAPTATKPTTSTKQASPCDMNVSELKSCERPV